MRIACLTGEYPTWSEEFIRRDLHGLQQRGHKIFVWSCGRPLNQSRWCGVDGIPLPPLEKPIPAAQAMRTVRTLSACGLLQTRRIIHVLRAATLMPMEPDVILAQFASLPAVISAGLAALLTKPLIISTHAHDIWVPWQPGIRALGFARAITCCNRCAADELIRILPGTQPRIRLAHHAVTVLAGHDHALPRNPNLVMACGRFVVKKGFAVLLQAFGQILSAVPGARLQLVGQGPEHLAYGRILREKALNTCVEILPRMEPAELADKMRQAAVLAAPSVIGPDRDRDGIPNVILEALALGTPVVATRVGGIPEVVHDQDTGWLVEPGNAPALAVAIIDALKNPERAGQLAVNGKALVRREFAQAVAAAELERVLQQAV